MNEKYLLTCSILFFILIFSNNAYSQNCEIQNIYTDRVYSKEEICKLEERICSLLNEPDSILKDNKVIKSYIPNIETDSKSFKIIYNFNIKND